MKQMQDAWPSLPQLEQLAVKLDLISAWNDSVVFDGLMAPSIHRSGLMSYLGNDDIKDGRRMDEPLHGPVSAIRLLPSMKQQSFLTKP